MTAKQAAATDEVDTSTNEDVEDDADFEDDADNVGFEAGEEVESKFGEDESKGKPASNSKDKADTDDEEVDESESEDEAADDEESTEDDESDQDESTEEDEAADDAESEDKADDKAGDKSTLSPEEIKRHNDEMAKARIAERKANQKAAKAKQEADDATIERYLREAGDDDIELERRKLNVEAFKLTEAKVAHNAEKLETGLQKAVATIPLFRTGDKAALDELYAAVDDFERMFVKKDAEGRPLEILSDVTTFLQAKAKSIERLQASGARQQGKSKSKQKSKTTTLPVKAPAKKKADEGMDAFDEEAARP